MCRPGLWISVAALALASPASAAEAMVQVSASYNIQAAIIGRTDEEVSQQEHKLKRAMYERGARECADLIATIATSCAITGINVSTQINQVSGQTPTIYVNSSVSMQVTLR